MGGRWGGSFLPHLICSGYFSSLVFGPENKQKQAFVLEAWSHREMPVHKAVTLN